MSPTELNVSVQFWTWRYHLDFSLKCRTSLTLTSTRALGSTHSILSSQVNYKLSPLTRSLDVPSLFSPSRGRRSAESLCVNCVACFRRLCWCRMALSRMASSPFFASLMVSDYRSVPSGAVHWSTEAVELSAGGRTLSEWAERKRNPPERLLSVWILF